MPHKSTHTNAGYYGDECLTVYYNRLQRDGWKLRSEDHQGAFLFERALPNSWVLRKLAFAEIGARPGEAVIGTRTN